MKTLITVLVNIWGYLSPDLWNSQIDVTSGGNICYLRTLLHDKSMIFFFLSAIFDKKNLSLEVRSIVVKLLLDYIKHNNDKKIRETSDYVIPI